MYKYKIWNLPFNKNQREKKLNELAKKGWELVTITYRNDRDFIKKESEYQGYFKRDAKK